MSNGDSKKMPIAIKPVSTAGLAKFDHGSHLSSKTVQSVSSGRIDDQTIFDELRTVVETASEAGWDGYDAEPISKEAYAHAYRFIKCLPAGSPEPFITAEPDGQLALEWHVSTSQTLSVSVSPANELHYSALLGPNKAYGTEAFLDEIPKTILNLIDRVRAA